MSEPSETPAELPESLGDYGDGISETRVNQQTARMIQRAVKQRWPIKPEWREGLLKRQVAIAVDPNSKPREATSAFRAIVSAEAQNQADEIPPDVPPQVAVQVNVDSKEREPDYTLGELVEAIHAADDDLAELVRRAHARERRE